MDFDTIARCEHDDETWKVNGNDYDLQTVAAHEIGHAIGLAHSSDSGSVMYAYYSGKRRKLRSGWIGATTSGSNTKFKVGRVDGSLFKPLTASADPEKVYAVLKLGATCPNGSVEFSPPST